MPTTQRAKTVDATPQEVWRVVGDPHHLPRWWPRVERIERVSGGRFTQVLRTKKGRPVRADFRIAERSSPERMRWVQEIAGTPFAKVLASAEVLVELAPVRGGTRVSLTLDQQLRGVSRTGGMLVRRASRKLLDEALKGLAHAL